jgi:hypothetical protein
MSKASDRRRDIVRWRRLTETDAQLAARGRKADQELVAQDVQASWTKAAEEVKNACDAMTDQLQQKMAELHKAQEERANR